MKIRDLNQYVWFIGMFLLSAAIVTGDGGCSKGNSSSAKGFPQSPTNLTATAADAKVNMIWEASPGDVTYNVYESTISNGPVTKTGASVTGCTITGLTNGSAYYFTVTALNITGESGPSNQVSVTPEPNAEDVYSSLNSLPNASLMVSYIGNAADQALSAANTQPPGSVSVVVNQATSYGSNNPLPTLSYLSNNMNTIVIKPQSMRKSALQALSVFKLTQVSGVCSPTKTDNSTPGTVDVTFTWSNASCTYSGTTVTMNGSVSVTGTYDSALGSVDLIETINLTEDINDPTSGLSESIGINGGDTVTGTGIVTGTTNMTYAQIGIININGSVTINNGSTGTFTGWEVVNNKFTGTSSQISYSGVNGTELNEMGITIGTYGVANLTMTITGSAPSQTVVINGSGTFGKQGNVAYSYLGKINAMFNNVAFNNALCTGSWPSGGTLTITANHTFVLDFSPNASGTNCYCANVTEDGGSQGLLCSL